MLKRVQDVIDLIEQKKNLLLAGDKNVLTKLPKGNWIAGTIPYFMDASGGTVTKDKIFVREVPHGLASIKTYSSGNLCNVLNDAPENGFSAIIIPAGSGSHIEYATNAPEYEQMFVKPIIGWISGIHLDDLGKEEAMVFNGETGEATSSDAVVMHFSLPRGSTAKISIINLFEQGTGPAISFPSEGFSAGSCEIEGHGANLASYIKDNGIDTKLPLVADYNGAMVNVSIQEVLDDKVNFYAPVFKDMEYRFAKPVGDYVSEFTKMLPVGAAPAFACNCILNFLYSELEGKQTRSMEGPVTFGEIAYQLLNQTLVYLEIV